MKFLKLGALLTSLVCSQVFASAVVCIDHYRDTVTVRSHYVYYGPHARYATAKACTDEINNLFNNGTQIQFNKKGKFRNLKFKVTFEVLNYADTVKKAEDNDSPIINFGRIDLPPKGSKTDVSFHLLKSNSAYFHIGNGLGSSTTCAHEYGHGLGLDHTPGHDFRGVGAPPIMAERGSIVDRQYQYDQGAYPGGPGGTVNPVHRKVSMKEIQALNLGDLDYRWVTPTLECAPLGSPLNIIYNNNGDKVETTRGKVPYYLWPVWFYF